MNLRIIAFGAAFLCGIALLARAGGLKDETVAGIKLGDPAQKVIAQFGGPEKKVESKEIEPATGCRYLTYQYPSKGLEFVLCEVSERGGEAVNDIRVFGKSEAKTGKGIGIGSAREEVEKAYGKVNNPFSGYDLGLVDEECWCALNFKLKDGKVTEIVFGSSGMPE